MEQAIITLQSIRYLPLHDIYPFLKRQPVFLIKSVFVFNFFFIDIYYVFQRLRSDYVKK